MKRIYPLDLALIRLVWFMLGMVAMGLFSALCGVWR